MSIACVHRVILVPAVAAAAATAAAPPADIGGVYSSLRTSEETGDTGGMRIILLASDRAEYAVLQCAGSVLDKPVLVRVDVDRAAGTLAFAAHDDPDNECPMEAFTAKSGKHGLRVAYPGNYDPGLLEPTRGFEP